MGRKNIGKGKRGEKGKDTKRSTKRKEGGKGGRFIFYICTSEVQLGTMKENNMRGIVERNVRS